MYVNGLSYLLPLDQGTIPVVAPSKLEHVVHQFLKDGSGLLITGGHETVYDITLKKRIEDPALEDERRHDNLEVSWPIGRRMRRHANAISDNHIILHVVDILNGGTWLNISLRCHGSHGCHGLNRATPFTGRWRRRSPAIGIRLVVRRVQFLGPDTLQLGERPALMVLQPRELLLTGFHCVLKDVMWESPRLCDPSLLRVLSTAPARRPAYFARIWLYFADSLCAHHIWLLSFVVITKIVPSTYYLPMKLKF